MESDQPPAIPPANIPNQEVQMNLSLHESANYRMRLARVAGLLYLLQMGFGVYAQLYARGSLLARGDAEKFATNILENETLFRVSIASDLACYILVLIATWALYVLLRPVDRNLALLAVFFRLMELSLHFGATVNSLSVLRLIRASVSSDQARPALEQAALSAIGTQGGAVSLGFILLGLGSGVFAYLFFRSRLIPRALSGLGMAASLAMTAFAFSQLVFPALTRLQYLPMAPMGIFEVSLGIWLLARGIASASDDPRAAPG